MEFKEPFKVYTAADNVEAHTIAQMLKASGIPAHAVEDQSVVGLFGFGIIGQVHKPDVWVDKSTAKQASQLVAQYEETARNRDQTENSAVGISAQCEDCGETTMYPGELDGTTQNCPHCHAYVDVGELDWDGDLGEDDSGAADCDEDAQE